jgi:hypothetical protein
MSAAKAINGISWRESRWLAGGISGVAALSWRWRKPSLSAECAAKIWRHQWRQ